MKKKTQFLNNMIAKYKVNVINKWGTTMLHHAVKKEDLWSVEFLIKAKANVNIQDIDKETPLHEATYRGNFEITKCLLENGAKDNLNIHDYTALRYAKEKGYWEIYNHILHYTIEDSFAKITYNESEGIGAII